MAPEELAYFHALYRTSVHGRKDLGKSLLNPDDDEITIDKSYTSRVAEIFAVILKSLGVRTDFVDEENILQPFDDESIYSFEIDGKSYFGTQYQQYLLTRINNIKNIILSEHGVLTEEELYKMIDDEMKSSKYVTGTVDYKEALKGLI